MICLNFTKREKAEAHLPVIDFTFREKYNDICKSGGACDGTGKRELASMQKMSAQRHGGTGGIFSVTA